MNALSVPRGVIIAPNGQPAALEAMRNNWYEGSRWSPNRSWIWFPVQDPKRDLDRFTRLELVKHARYLYKNSPLVRGLIERYVTLVVGSGFTPVFKSSSEDWNKRAKVVWKKKCRNVHLGPRCSMLDYQRAIGRARALDGECFSVKTSDETVNFETRVQGLEAERCGGLKGKDISQESSEFAHSGLVDGFNLNRQGIVTSYNFRDVEQPYPAEYVVHHYTPNRLGQYRGETLLSAAINTARDVDDILALEKQAVKEASAKKDIIKTASGQLDFETFRSLRYGDGVQAGAYPTVFSLPADTNAKDDYYRIQFGGQPTVLRRGDEYTPYIPNRPGQAWQGFMDFLSMTICLSSGFPPSVILPINVGGVDIRRDLDIAQKVVEPIQMDIACELDEVTHHLLLDEVEDGVLRQGLPQDWQNISWQFPQKVNVDRQQAQADRDDVARGLMSREEYHGRWAEDYDAIDAQVIKEAKARKTAILGAGFKDVKEFVEVVSLDSKMFMTRSQEDDALATGKPEPAPGGPGKKPQKQLQNA